MQSRVEQSRGEQGRLEADHGRAPVRRRSEWAWLDGRGDEVAARTALKSLPALGTAHPNHDAGDEIAYSTVSHAQCQCCTAGTSAVPVRDE